jgi:TolB-like protein/DNA-binding winged helix-turn-helix (wHTH) protein
MVSSGNPVRFGVFELHPQTGELFKGGMRLRLHGQPLQLLSILLEHAGEVVTREHLQQFLWPEGTFVDFEHSLNAAVKRLREVLGDSSDHPIYIETLPRHGYRFIAPIEGREKKQESMAAVMIPEHPDRTRPRSQTLLLVFSVATVLLIPLWWIMSRPEHSVAGSVPTLAVLPMENLSDDPGQENFADGLTEALITDLGRVRSIRVISRQSVIHYKGSTKTIPQIAGELHANVLLEGSTLVEGKRVRICAQLIRARPEEHLWAQSYDLQMREVLTLQAEVARSIVDEVQRHLSPSGAE